VLPQRYVPFSKTIAPETGDPLASTTFTVRLLWTGMMHTVEAVEAWYGCKPRSATLEVTVTSPRMPATRTIQGRRILARKGPADTQSAQNVDASTASFIVWSKRNGMKPHISTERQKSFQGNVKSTTARLISCECQKTSAEC
jgi:hypothetical protein